MPIWASQNLLSHKIKSGITMASHRFLLDRKRRAAALQIGIFIASCAGAAGQDIGDAAAGHEIATRWCGDCHVTGYDQRQGTSTGAPTFAAIAKMKMATDKGLRAFLQTPHDRMPDLHLTSNETDDLIAYIRSRRRVPGG
jgi:mono/diheme cytochrome c family protein